MHDGTMFGMGSGMGWLWLIGLIALVAIVWAVSRAASSSRPVDGGPTRDRSPEDVLRDRFARGEIDEQEFRSRLAALRDGR